MNVNTKVKLNRSLSKKRFLYVGLQRIAFFNTDSCRKTLVMLLCTAVLLIFTQRMSSHVRFYSHLLKKNWMKNFIIRALYVTNTFICAIKAHFKCYFTTSQETGRLKLHELVETDRNCFKVFISKFWRISGILPNIR